MDNQNTINIQNCGINQGAGGNITAGNNLTIINNPPPTGTSTAIRKIPFRFNIPTPSRHFKGRRDTLEAIRDYFTNLPTQTDDCWEKIAAMVGLGGMGKTETAYVFAAEFKKTFPNVAWIDAETENSALASFRGLANRLGIDLKGRQGLDIETVKAVYYHLDQEDYGSVLFIFDNAIRLNSDGEEFGITEYLPTDDLTNQRFPYVLITTQTHDWGRRIETFQVDKLSETESLEFFRSCFQVESAEYDDQFKKLNKLLEGYPLVMNLAASQVDYNPKKDSHYELKQQLNNYIQKLEKKQDNIFSQKINRAWPTKYNKTLSNVWQLTFERIQQEENGHEALELLQFMSFLRVSIDSNDIVAILVRSSDCPHPPKKESQVRLKESIRLLERFYLIRIAVVRRDNEEVFDAHFQIHRLVQLVVREQMDSSKVIERLLFCFASHARYSLLVVNKSALEEALHRIQLSQRALLYVGVLACRGFPAACKIVQTREPETKAAAAIWRLYYLKREMTTFTENATQVLHELIALKESEEQLEDQKCFGDVIRLLTDKNGFKHEKDLGTVIPAYFDLDSLDGIEELVAQLILNVYSVQYLSCKSFYCEEVRKERDKRLSDLTAKLSKTFIRANRPHSTLTVDVVAETWFALFAKLKYYDPHEEYYMPYFLLHFWEDTYEAFHSPNASQSRIGALKTCLWNHGLAKELIQIFGFISHCLHVSYRWSNPWLLPIMDFCIDGMDFRDERIQEILSSICLMAKTIEVEYTSQDYSRFPNYCRIFAYELCAIRVKMFLMDERPPSHKLLESLTKWKFLDWIERSPKFGRHGQPFFGWTTRGIPGEYLSEYFPQFIQRFSCSDIKAIQMLVTFCRRMIEDSERERWRRPE